MPDDRTPLLPPNASPLERATAEALAEIQRVPVPLRDLWRPATCPAHLLPYLAWAFSVDRWDPSWSEAAKRDVIASAFYVHQRKGTISALRRVVEPLGYLRIGVLDTGITEAMYTELERLIDDAKPVSRHVSGLDLAGESRGVTYLASTVYDGDVTAVLPFVAEETEVSGLMFLGAATDSTDTATVYPLP